MHVFEHFPSIKYFSSTITISLKAIIEGSFSKHVICPIYTCFVFILIFYSYFFITFFLPIYYYYYYLASAACHFSSLRQWILGEHINNAAFASRMTTRPRGNSVMLMSRHWKVRRIHSMHASFLTLRHECSSRPAKWNEPGLLDEYVPNMIETLVRLHWAISSGVGRGWDTTPTDGNYYVYTEGSYAIIKWNNAKLLTNPHPYWNKRFWIWFNHHCDSLHQHLKIY